AQSRREPQRRALSPSTTRSRRPLHSIVDPGEGPALLHHVSDHETRLMAGRTRLGGGAGWRLRRAGNGELERVRSVANAQAAIDRDAGGAVEVGRDDV